MDLLEFQKDQLKDILLVGILLLVAGMLQQQIN
jgi:hypothetical protein